VPGQGIGERGYQWVERDGAVSGELHGNVLDQLHDHHISRRLRRGEEGGRPEECRERERDCRCVCERERIFLGGVRVKVKG